MGIGVDSGASGREVSLNSQPMMDTVEAYVLSE